MISWPALPVSRGFPDGLSVMLTGNGFPGLFCRSFLRSKIGHCIWMIAYHRNGLSNQPLNIAQKRDFGIVAKRECDTTLSGASGPSDPVHVCLRNIGNLKVYHMG